MSTMATKPVERTGIATGTHGRAKLRLMQCHRLVMFQQAFDLYLSGGCSAAYVTARARKMLDIGLPPFAIPGKGRR